MARSTSILTVTDELWITAVKTVPSSTAMRGDCRDANICKISGESFIPDIAPDIELSPMKRTPKPIIASPHLEIFCFLTNMRINTPASRITGAAFSSLKETRSAVTVVPTLAPRMTPAACVSVISPELTKLTTMTVHAEEDWTTAVKNTPTKIAIKRLVVNRSSIPLNFAPATFSILSLIMRIPYRNSPKPPAMDRIIDILILV